MEEHAPYLTPGQPDAPPATSTADWLREEIRMHQLVLQRDHLPDDESEISHWALVHLRRLLALFAPNDPLLQEIH